MKVMADVLVNTDWVAQHATDAGVRVVEVDVDTGSYDQGHVPGSAGWNWTTELCDTLVRDIVPAKKLEELLGKSGIDNKTTIVLYGDNNNWFAAWAFWQLKVYGHDDVRIMDGGRKKWLAEGRDLTTDKASFTATTYKAGAPDLSLRAFLPEVQQAVAGKKAALVDVRSPQEFSGERTHMAEYPQEGVLRGGHIPGAKNVPWARAANPEDGTFKDAAGLRAIYENEIGLKPEDDVIAYCRIGERSSHTWFVLTYLLGYKRVRNYDGSWTEWGNAVGMPIERP